MFPPILIGFIFLVLIFVPLERLFPLYQQKLFRPLWMTDIVYFFLGHFIGRGTGLLTMAIFGVLPRYLVEFDFQRIIANQGVVFQLLEMIVIADLGYYIAHRMFHEIPWLWKFHAIHHGIEDMDWLATIRIHPVEQIITKLFQIVPLFWLGFSDQSLIIYSFYSSAIAFFIHANIKLRFGWLKWLIATPEFHHWHHAHIPPIYNKNYAVQFPLIDWVFGTIYMSHKSPKAFGVSESIPLGYLSQFIYPFVRNN